MSDMENPKNPWGQLPPAEYEKMDEEQAVKDTFDDIVKEVERAKKELGVSYQLDRGEGHLSFSVKGNLKALQMRVANLVGRANEALESIGRKSRLMYGSTDEGAYVSIEKLR